MQQKILCICEAVPTVLTFTFYRIQRWHSRCYRNKSNGCSTLHLAHIAKHRDSTGSSGGEHKISKKKKLNTINIIVEIKIKPIVQFHKLKQVFYCNKHNTVNVFQNKLEKKNCLNTYLQPSYNIKVFVSRMLDSQITLN